METLLDKIIAVISAVILGAVIMFLPILLFGPVYQYGQADTKSATDMNQEFGTAQTLGRTDVGAVGFPSSLVYAGIVVAVGFVVALSMSFWVRRRAVPSWSTSSADD